jgi:hypothetical protein
MPARNASQEVRLELNGGVGSLPQEPPVERRQAGVPPPNPPPQVGEGKEDKGTPPRP